MPVKHPLKAVVRIDTPGPFHNMTAREQIKVLNDRIGPNPPKMKRARPWLVNGKRVVC
jgi:hypothetical protein